MTELEPVDVVAAAPHPDDLELLCGGTLAKLVRQGYRVAMIDLTSGEPTPRGSLEIRQHEAEAARQALGVQARLNLDLPNRELMDGPPARYALATALRRLKPKILIAGAGRTPAASPDHHQGHLIIEAARFYAQLTKWDDRFEGTPPYRVPHLIYAPFPFDAERRGWHATFTIDISDTFEAKMAAVRCYTSQFDGGRFERVRHFVAGANAAAGALCGFFYGETFAVPQPLAAVNLMDLFSGGQDSPTPEVKPGKDHLPFG